MNPTRRKALGATLVVTGALAAMPAGASATTQSCAGHWSKASKTATADLTTNSGVQYAFACSQNIHAFSVVASRTMDVFSVQASSFAPTDHSPGLLMSCEGPIPGNGASCFGDKPTDKVNAGFVVVGQLGSEVGPCDWDPNSPVPFNLSLVVSDNGGTLAGPFALKPPRGCAKHYRKAVKAAQKHKKR